MKRFHPWILLALSLLICALTARDFLLQHRPDAIVAGPGVTEQRRLSEWMPELEGTRGDTEVYLLAGADTTGGDVLVLGGTHPNEPAAFLAAVLLVENLQVSHGRLWVIPQANHSAFSQTEPQEAHPQFFHLPDREGGERRFRMGSRLSNPLDQWPDPEITVHHPSGQSLSGNETRNLNRCFPGRREGTHTERVAWAIRHLVDSEDIKLLIDIHEASIEYPVVNAVVAHEHASDIAGMAVFNLAMEGLDYNLEPSPKNLHGLSHRELGDHCAPLYATLLETANVIQGRLRGKTSEAVLLSGDDPCYHDAGEIGMNRVHYPEEGIPFRQRVWRHIAACRELIGSYSMMHPEAPLYISGFPEGTVLLEEGCGPYLMPVP